MKPELSRDLEQVAPARGILALLVALAVACVSEPVPEGPLQRVRVVDEDGDPVAGAEVRMLGRPAWARTVDQVERTDEEGWALFARGERRRYEASATEPMRRFVGSGDLPENFAHSIELPLVLRVSELWVGGVRVAGQRIVRSSCIGWDSFAVIGGADLPPELLRRWPDAAWLGAYRRSEAEAGPQTLELELDVYGFAPTVVRVPMARVTGFVEPLTLEPALLEPMPWVNLPIVLRDPDGTPLDEDVQRAVCSIAVLRRRLDPDPGHAPRHRSYRLATGAREPAAIALPCGRYALHLENVSSLGAGELEWRSEVGPLEVRPEDVALDVTLPVTLRRQRVQFSPTGRGPRSFAVAARHGSGFEGKWLGDDSGFLDLALPPGRNDLTLEVFGPDGEFWRLQRSVEVGHAAHAGVEWELP